MKNLIFLLFAAISFSAHAQVGGFSENTSGSIKLGTGYVHDFPGLNGFGAYGEYSFPLNEWLQGGIGLKRIQTSGYPRTTTVKEYTNATTLDFNLLFVPFRTDNAVVRIGAGYSFSFYKMRRSYPVYDTHIEMQSANEPGWQVQDAKGRVNGISLMGEYEYYFENNISAGARISLSKAYKNVVMAGPFIAIRL